MLYYDKIDLSEGIGDDKSNSSRECMVCHNCFLVMGLNLKSLFAMGVMIWQCCVLILVILLLLLLKLLIIAVVFMNITRSEAINLLKKLYAW